MTRSLFRSPSALPLVALATLLALPRRALADPAIPTPEEVFSYDALCVHDDPEHDWSPCRGIAHDGISYADFYRIAGRQDLASADHSRWFRRQLGLSIGAVALVLGAASALPRLGGKSIAPLWLSAGTVAAGLALYVWGTQISQEPLVDRPAADELARAYNRGLRERLGLPSADGRRLAIGLGFQRAF
jgi:hypothetical protein